MHFTACVGIRRAGIALMLLASVALVGPASADILTFTAQIDGAQANNCAGTGSPATGTGSFTLDTNTLQVSYNITFDVGSLLGTETAAHVHGAAAACSPAGIVYSLPTGSPKIGMTTLTAQQAQDMIDGLHYVNIHSTVVSGGEIRGQILPDSQAVPSLGEWAFVVLAAMLVLAGVLAVRRRRASFA
jgi:hypothetical protein